MAHSEESPCARCFIKGTTNPPRPAGHPLTCTCTICNFYIGRIFSNREPAPINDNKDHLLFPKLTCNCLYCFSDLATRKLEENYDFVCEKRWKCVCNLCILERGGRILPPPGHKANECCWWCTEATNYLLSIIVKRNRKRLMNNHRQMRNIDFENGDEIFVHIAFPSRVQHCQCLGCCYIREYERWIHKEVWTCTSDCKCILCKGTALQLSPFCEQLVSQGRHKNCVVCSSNKKDLHILRNMRRKRHLQVLESGQQTKNHLANPRPEVCACVFCIAVDELRRFQLGENFKCSLFCAYDRSDRCPPPKLQKPPDHQHQHDFACDVCDVCKGQVADITIYRKKREIIYVREVARMDRTNCENITDQHYLREVDQCSCLACCYLHEVMQSAYGIPVTCPIDCACSVCRFMKGEPLEPPPECESNTCLCYYCCYIRNRLDEERTRRIETKR